MQQDTKGPGSSWPKHFSAALEGIIDMLVEEAKVCVVHGLVCLREAPLLNMYVIGKQSSQP